MSELESGIESGAPSESSVSSEPVSPVQAQETATQQDAKAESVQKEPPFNEHPRFKELIAERNAEREAAMRYAQEAATFKAQLEQYNKQTQSKPAKQSFDPVFERLKGIDPEFADLVKSSYEKAQDTERLQQELSEIKQWKSSYEQQQSAQVAQSQFEKLCGENKVSDADKEVYKQFVTNMAYQRNAGVKDLPGIFNEAHQQLSKYFENRDRSLKESYVSQKKADATPASQTGGIAPSAKSSSGKAPTIDDVKAQLAASLRNGMRI